MAELSIITCTCCGKEKKATNPGNKFYQSQSVLYEHYQHIPICKDCIDIIYNNYKNKHKDDKLTIYNLCRLLDLPYSEGAFYGAVQHSEKTNWKLYQSYFKQINSFGGTNNYGMDFSDSEAFISDKEGQIQEEANDQTKDLDIFTEEDVSLETQIFWGSGFEKKDYVFLEVEINNWKKTHKCDNQAELTLLKEICIKILEIRRLRESQKSVSKEQKELQDLMKTASVDPAKANMADGGKSLDSFGLWVKEIENHEPAEFFEDKELFNDFDGIKKYSDRYIFRPLKNLLTGSRDFNIDDNDNISEGEE